MTEQELADPYVFDEILAVHKGAKYLDKKVKNWFKKIDLVQLDQIDGEKCVLAQLFPKPTIAWQKKHAHTSPYVYACDKLFGKQSSQTVGKARLLGFCPLYWVTRQVCTAAWKHEITKRLNQSLVQKRSKLVRGE